MRIMWIFLLGCALSSTVVCHPHQASAVQAEQRTLVFVFGAEGVYVIDPESKRILSTLAAEGVCTKSKNRFSRSNCSIGGAAVVKDELIFFSDSPGDRVQVLDVETVKITETIPTGDYPFDLYYLPWLEEVWVHSWNTSTFDVINTAGRLKRTHKAIKAHVQPGWTHGYLYADQQLKDGKVGYVTHLFNPGLHQLDLTTKSYKEFVNMSSYGCTGTFHLAYSSVNKHAFFECMGSDELIELNVATDQHLIVGRWNLTGAPYVSPDGRYIVALHSKVNRTLNLLLDSKVHVFAITSELNSRTTLKAQMSIPGGVSDLVFRPKENQPGHYFVFISLIYGDKVAVLDLDHLESYGRLTYIEGVGSVKSSPMMHAVGRPIVVVGDWIVSPATANDSVAIINAKTRVLHGMVSGVVGGKRFAVVNTKTSSPDSSGQHSSPALLLIAVTAFAFRNVFIQ